jgi:hypothetical protein
VTTWRVFVGFGAGFVVAGAVAGLARVAGLDEPPAAIADVEPPAAAAPRAAAGTAAAPPVAAADAAPRPDGTPVGAAAPVGPAPADAKPSRRWRTPRNQPADEVPAGVIARVASRRGVERRCVAAPSSNPCAEDAGRVDSVEIEWHGPAPKP